MNIITANNINHSYIFAQREIKSLKNISFKIEKSEFISIVGMNGCGKSTLVKHLNALISLQSGGLTIASLDCRNNKNMYKIRQKCGMVFQNPDNQFVSTVVKEDVEFSLKNHDIKYDDKTIDDVLTLVGLKGFEKRDILTLSGGQKQRLALAGILCVKPDIIILDEATSMLSPNSRKEVLDIIQKLHKETDITFIMITQYAEETVNADRIIVMNDGKIIESGVPEEIYSNEELIEKSQISLPYCVKIYNDLKKAGIFLDECPLNNERLVELLCRLK